jgi:hypothetical protein
VSVPPHLSQVLPRVYSPRAHPQGGVPSDGLLGGNEGKYLVLCGSYEGKYLMLCGSYEGKYLLLCGSYEGKYLMLCCSYESKYLVLCGVVSSVTVVFYTPVENGTYYGMVMSVRFSVHPSVCPSHS